MEITGGANASYHLLTAPPARSLTHPPAHPPTHPQNTNTHGRYMENTMGPDAFYVGENFGDLHWEGSHLDYNQDAGEG